jgi:hypothetical protein
MQVFMFDRTAHGLSGLLVLPPRLAQHLQGRLRERVLLGVVTRQTLPVVLLTVRQTFLLRPAEPHLQISISTHYYLNLSR